MIVPLCFYNSNVSKRRKFTFNPNMLSVCFSIFMQSYFFKFVPCKMF